ncbi:MAG: DinB family protein [Candidatus Sulfotelmatobacter sp.]
MDILEHFRRQFSYDLWANGEVLSRITQVQPESSVRSLQLLAHIVSAERLWLERIRHQPQTLPVWPELNVERCQEHIAELTRLWKEYFAGLALADLMEEIAYKNSKGESWSNTVHDILTHVLLHSAYHRGQIANVIRSSGAIPAYTDFILALRQGLLK